MLDLATLPARWGKRHFKRPSAAALKLLESLRNSR